MTVLTAVLLFDLIKKVFKLLQPNAPVRGLYIIEVYDSRKGFATCRYVATSADYLVDFKSGEMVK
jgi:hypothetical protein